ncbi:polyphosphate kinase 1 [soil metagenome]
MVPTAVVAQPVPSDAELGHPSLYLNRELGWLDFNWRVLQQARDERHPLLERVRFIGITCSNLDEFYQKRVGGLKRQEIAGLTTLSLDGRHASEQLRLIRSAARVMQDTITDVWEDGLRHRLADEAGVVVSVYSDLSASQREQLDRHFIDHIYPILTPLAVDPGHPFPLISNLSLSLAVQLRHPSRGTSHFVRLKVPTTGGRWLRLSESRHAHEFVPIEEIVRNNVHLLFAGMEVESVWAFRVTRNADISRDDEETEDLLALVSEELRERRFAPVVRLEVEAGMPDEPLDLLLRELELGHEDVVHIRGLLGLDECEFFASLDIPRHHFPPWEPLSPQGFGHPTDMEEERSIFALIRTGDVLVHHPYDAFNTTVQRLVEEAANDPAVVAIKQTLYRTSEGSPIVRSLIRAAEAGKQVAVLVEVTARFEEVRNIGWAQVLEDAGVHVTYGVMGLKTHAKVVLVVRYESGSPRVYCHIGTGNYHARTAKLYTDIGLLTGDQTIGADVVNLFHFLTGHAPDQQYRELVVAPRDMRDRFVELIRREVENQRRDGNGRILAKMNALDDSVIIPELYRASREGVRIDLIIRGHCRLRPKLPGFSENIRVRSLIGRFLEHDRIYTFHNGGDPEVYVGSADWRDRNLDRRVEAVISVKRASIRDRLLETLDLALRDNRLAWEMNADGSWTQLSPRSGEPEVNYQQLLMNAALERAHAGAAAVGDSPRE